MSQSTRSGSKSAIRLTTDEAEVRDALLDHSDGAWVLDQIDASEDTATKP